jgi:hypothetical protein
MEKFMSDILLRTGQIDRQEYINEMSKKDSFVCNMCGKEFKNKKEYDMHKDGKNSDKKYYCKAMKEEIETEEEVFEGSEGDAGGAKKYAKDTESDDYEDDSSEGGDEVSKLKAEIKELKAEIKELKGGGKKKKKKKDDDDEYDTEDADDSDDDKMAKLRAMKKKA